MSFVEISSLSAKEMSKGFYARAIHTGTISLLYWTVEEGASSPLHSHQHEQVAHVLKGRFELTVADEIKVLEPGMVAVIPPHTLHGGKALTHCELLDIFHPEREDYKF